MTILTVNSGASPHSASPKPAELKDRIAPQVADRASDRATPIPASPPSQEQIEAAIKEIQMSIKNTASDLHFNVDQETGRTVISVIDKTSGDLIRQVPSEEILSIAKAVSRMQGLLVNGKA